ncbi:hypothetical protein HOY34_19725 [Xinfangfangia sp. D13-10-4-6]|uniref:YncE family protein n=1 Tax=Pseudogemmobacter hezensis TaxID=2737662 RepID=UPI00155789C9|nr:WD40 repeat domain-containing protein [Pseudogemmobacter hezensis]NPD17419.1 hypothetical protein [Pseudogemmobacter hezensis]
MRPLSRLCAASALVIASALWAPLARAETPAPQTDPARPTDPIWLTPAEIAAAITRQDSLKGLYELRYSPALGQIFVTATPGFGDDLPGFLHVLEADSLRVIRQIQLPRRAFALALDEGRGLLYVGHTMDGAISVVDAKSGQVLNVIQLGQPDAEGKTEHTRMIRLDTERQLAFVTSPGADGLVWIVDTATGSIRHRISDAGLWRAGAAYDAQRGVIWVSGGGMEEVNGWSVETGEKVAGFSTGDTTAPGKEASQHFFVNLAIDEAGQRLFATDSNSGALYTFDIATGKLTGRTEIGVGPLDVVFNAARNEIYVTWRGDSREVSGGTGGLAILDGTDLSVRHRLDLPAHPNTIEMDAKGDTLWLTVKAPYSDKHPAWRAEQVDQVLRLDLPLPAQARQTD